MFRIEINWDVIHPSLHTASGIVTVLYVEGSWTKHIEVAKFRIKSKPGSTSYTALEGKTYSSLVFEAIKPQLDIMIHQFVDGMLLNKQSIEWIMESELDKSRKQLDLLNKSIKKCENFKNERETK